MAIVPNRALMVLSTLHPTARPARAFSEGSPGSVDVGGEPVTRAPWRPR